ncbi:MAG: hypothetical protein NTW13_03935, partial [Candidatus Omnitrophica bacterium]|nr:hypothetical protein [Candidatus Omnitrophota bacterium]
MPASSQDQAKRYSQLKYTFSLIGIAYTLFLLLVFLATGLSRDLAFWTGGIVTIYLLVIFLACYILTFPLTFDQSYTLEHKFALSNQGIRDWIMDQLKSGAISYIIGLILISAFYLILKFAPHIWWVVISLFWIFFSVVLAKLMPIIIIPLFFKYKKLDDDNLRSRIMNLAQKMEVKIL